MKLFIDFLVDMAVEEATQRRTDGMPGDEPRPSGPQSPLSQSSDEPSSRRYMLPEFDIDVFLPATGKGKGGYRATAKFGYPSRDS
jgi:hypothetical protein